MFVILFNTNLRILNSLLKSVIDCHKSEKMYYPNRHHQKRHG